MINEIELKWWIEEMVEEELFCVWERERERENRNDKHMLYWLDNNKKKKMTIIYSLHS
jgi:hypothetical protein